MTGMDETQARGFDSELSIRAVGPASWVLLAPLVWTGTRGDRVVVPVGFETDFATVPQFMQGQFRTYGPYTRAAVLHDYLLTELAAGSHAVTSRDIDGMFRRVMKDLGVPGARRWVMWAGVRWGALFSARRAYQRGFTADAWRVVGVSALAFPVIVWGAVGNLISAGLAKPFTAFKPSPPTVGRGTGKET